jgi:hypothetical protein
VRTPKITTTKIYNKPLPSTPSKQQKSQPDTAIGPTNDTNDANSMHPFKVFKKRNTRTTTKGGLSCYALSMCAFSLHETDAKIIQIAKING